MKQTNELKTLKDISPLAIEGTCCCHDSIKEEAIKWIKELERHKDYCFDCEFCDENRHYSDSGAGEYSSEKYGNVVCWIIDFFNITKEDLK